jgi:dolichyl-phosphate beta-glucosyltransferase
VVIPAYNEARRLPRTLERLASYLDGRLSYELLVVDDGSRDGTADAARGAVAPPPSVLRHEPNRGKGYAVRQGMAAARGERVLMTDADLSSPIEELPRLMAALDGGYQVAIGSRAAPGAQIEVHQPWRREWSGRAFNVCVRLLALPGIADTQCGFKLFDGEAARQVFPRCRLDGFAFDVEALFVARRLGYRIAEVPVRWRNDDATRVSLLAGARAFADLARLRLDAWRGRYASGPAREGGTG